MLVKGATGVSEVVLKWSMAIEPEQIIINITMRITTLCDLMYTCKRWNRIKNLRYHCSMPWPKTLIEDPYVLFGGDSKTKYNFSPHYKSRNMWVDIIIWPVCCKIGLITTECISEACAAECTRKVFYLPLLYLTSALTQLFKILMMKWHMSIIEYNCRFIMYPDNGTHSRIHSICNNNEKLCRDRDSNRQKSLLLVQRC